MDKIVKWEIKTSYKLFGFSEYSSASTVIFMHGVWLCFTLFNYSLDGAGANNPAKPPNALEPNAVRISGISSPLAFR